MGDCISGECVCDPGFTNPVDGGVQCSAFDLGPAAPEQPGYLNDSWPTWGGRPVFYSAAQGGDNLWHLFTAQFAEHCNVDNWVKNSFVAHVVGKTPRGPWTHLDVAIPVFSHAPQVVRHPDGTWLLWFVGGWHYPSHDWKNCSDAPWVLPPVDGKLWPPPGLGPGEPATPDGCGPTENAGCGIRLATSHSPYGPWTIHNVTLTNGNASWACSRSVPSPVAMPDGSVYVAFGAEPCNNSYETVGIMRADHWSKPFTILAEPIALPNTFHCPTGDLAEDPYLWHDGKRGWHLIMHGLCDWNVQDPKRPEAEDLYAMHAYTTDPSKGWTVSTRPDGKPSLAWSKHVHWTNGSTTYISRMERPQLVHHSSTSTGPAFMLSTAVCPGGMSVGGAACLFVHPSWGLYRPLNQQLVV